MNGGSDRAGSERARRATFVLGSVLAVSCGGVSAPRPLKPVTPVVTPTASRSAQATSSAAPIASVDAGTSTASAELSPQLHESAIAPAAAAPERHENIRKPAATPLEAACYGPSTACQCPDFSGFPEGKGRAALLRRGSFSGPYPEALVEVMMCEGHANNFGGTVLVRKVDAGWLPIGYVAGFVPRSCSAHRGADGLERLACFETYGFNQGTYGTSASVLDFAAKHYDVLSEAMCEDARDVKGVRWLSSIPADQDVELVIEAGLRRDNGGDACRTVGGTARLLRLRYSAQSTGYVPTREAEAQLRTLVVTDSDFAVDSAVAGAMLSRAAPITSWPVGVRPERRPLNLGLPNN